MKNLGHLVGQNVSLMIKRWIDAVRDDQNIDSAQELPDLEIRDYLPSMLHAIAARLTQALAPTEARTHKIEIASLDHGIPRAGDANTGTGLGLAIVAKTVALLQGTIALASKLGEDSTFTVTLPQHAHSALSLQIANL